MRRLIGYFRPPLFLFQMGKVGSSTHTNTLQTLYHVYHLHTLRDFKTKYDSIHRRTPGLKEKSLDLITICREPIGRKVSAFFQNLVDSPYPFCFSSKDEALAAGTQELLDRFRAWDDGIEEATGWFDKHFEPATGIRIYDHEFDREKGWNIIRSGRWRILVLRFTDIRKNHVEALDFFVKERFGSGAAVPNLLTRNVSSEKWYADLMNDFLKRLTFTQDELDRAYHCQYSRYFHTQQELDDFRNKWHLKK
jgi:hypothetical protein